MQATDRLSTPGGGDGGTFGLPPRWRLEGRLGSGGQAEVWLATDTQLNEPVAIKFYGGAYSGEARARWRRELRLGRLLQHPHLIRIHELIETEEGVALAMEYLPGGSLAARLAKEGPLPPAQVEEVALHTLEALCYLHAHDIVHRDVKPSNLLLDGEGSLRLADLGVAKSLAPSDGATQTSLTPGSPAYMSPEQLQNGEVGPPSDLYSLGVTLYELLTGKLPYEGKSTYEVATGHLRGELPSPKQARPDCPRWLSRFIRRLMEKRPQDRFPTAEAALHALETRRGLFSRRMVKRLLLNGAAALLLVAAATAGALAWHWGEMARARAVRTSFEGNTLRGLDASGKTLWTVKTLAPIQQVEQADLYGDGKRESVVVSFDPAESHDLSRSPSAHTPPQVLIVSPEGRVLNEFRPEESIPDDGHLVAPPLLIPTVTTVDLFGDRTRQILVNAHHRSLGTAYLWLYYPHQNIWEELLDHWGGWILAVQPVPQSRPPLLRLLCFNGIIASEPVEAELAVRPPGSGSAMMESGSTLPGAQGTEYGKLIWYTALLPTIYGDRDQVKGFTLGIDGSSRFTSNGKLLILDRWGNPVPGPNAGRDLAGQRLALWSRAYDLYERAPQLGGSLVQQVIASLKEQYADLLREEPEQAGFQQISARALARAGDTRAAVALLVNALKQDGFNDSLTLNLGQFLAIEGHLAEARHVLEHGYLDNQTPAGSWLCVKVLGRIAIETHDDALLQKVDLQLSNIGYTSSVGEVLSARARLWWNESIQADTHLGSYDLAPEGEAIACLARWRLHEIEPGDVAAMTDSLRRNPDAAGECLIARAMARLSLGHPNAAVSDCLEAERRLSERAPCEFWAYQTMQLAQACHATALLAAGRTQDAAALARDVLPRLHPGLLPYLLVQRVLASTKGGTR
ncbi:MAG: serine/threonine-protein kinase [Acidobacteriota bacterium]